MARDDELVGVSEIARAFDIKKNSAWRWTKREGFPPPAAELARGRVWRRRDVEEWVEKRRPRPGRPRGPAEPRS